MLKLKGFIAALLIVGSLGGCAWWNAKGKQAALDIINCAIESVRNQTPALVDQIYKILDGQPANWGSAVSALESAGLDALPCAIMAVISDLTMKQAAAQRAGNQLAGSVHDAKIQFLVAHLTKLSKARS